MSNFPRTLENNLRALNRNCRPYFPRSATAEILEEFRPLMCPFDVTMGKAMAYFEMLLPTCDGDEGYKLWFGEFMSFWDACYNAPPWEGVSKNRKKCFQTHE